MRRLRRALPTVLLCAAVLACYCGGWLRYAENWFQDKLYQHPGLIEADIQIIGIDEKTLLELGPFDTWSRRATAELLDILTASPESAPAVIGIDIGFYGEKDARIDQALADAARRAGNVVAASYVTFGGEVVQQAGSFYARRAVKTVEEPFPALAQACSSGFTNVLAEEDGVVRRALYALGGPEEQSMPSFAHAVYDAYGASGAPPSLDADGQWHIPFTGAPRDYFGASFSDVLLGRADAAQFAGSIVLIGPYSSGLMDAYHTPVSRSDEMYGVEVHANILQAMLAGEYRRALPFSAGLALLATVLAAALLLARRDLRLGAAACAAFTIGYPLLARLLYGGGVILPLLYPLIGFWAVFLLRVVHNYFLEAHERRRLLELFGRYVSPAVADSVVRQGEGRLGLGGQSKDIAVLFVDIRGFTPLSESLSPEQVVLILDRYFELTTRAIFENGGTVDKFIGDATMALFNAPLDTPDYEYCAVCAALSIAAGAQELSREIEERFGRGVALGIGIHCGPAVVGSIGTAQRMEYTAIGDTVNTAARLEGQAGSGEILISEELYRRLGGRLRVRCLGARALKGKSGASTVYCVEGFLAPLPDEAAARLQ